jgi:hypothetical protein
MARRKRQPHRRKPLRADWDAKLTRVRCSSCGYVQPNGVGRTVDDEDGNPVIVPHACVRCGGWYATYV